MGETIIRVRSLTTDFRNQTVLENLDLDVFRGEILGIVGGSGTGKSVLMRAIIGLDRPRGGTIEMFGRQLDTLSRRERGVHMRRFGVLFQDAALFSSLTVGQNIELPLRESPELGLSERLMDEIAALKIGMVGLPPESGTKYPSQLSGGMRKRAGLARALALDPEIVFLDEPTAGLDPIGAASFDRLIGDLSRSLGLTVFMVTHDLDSLYTVCDRIAVLAEKKVLATGNIADMLTHDHPWIQSYFGGPRGRAARDASLGRSA